MSRRVVSGMMLTLLLISMLTLTFNIQRVKASGTIYIRADGSIDPPTANITTADNIIYYFTDNNYDEIVVERSNIIVDGNRYTVQGGRYGFYPVSVSNVTIKNTKITNCWCGISLYESFNNSISGNNITNNEIYGIWLQVSSNNISISGNNITNNVIGIDLHECSNNMLRNNHMSSNKYNFHVYGWVLSDFMHDVDSSNTVDGKPVYYWVNMQNRIVPADAGYVALVNSTNITAQNLELKKNYEGALLAYTKNSLIISNNMTNNAYAIRLLHSPNNMIAGNNITNNTIWLSYSCNNTISGSNIINNELHGPHACILDYSSNSNTIIKNEITSKRGSGIYLHLSSNNSIFGNNITNEVASIVLSSSSNNNTIAENNIINNGDSILLSHSSNNTIYRNNFITNTRQVYSSDSVNIWDDGYPSGGNYWADYTDDDEKSGPNQDQPGSDGIWDHPYVIDADNQDRYPLVNPWSPIPEDKPPTCVIQLQEDGVEIDEIDVGQFFDIYVGDSTDDIGIEEVRFSSDDLQDGNPIGEWTEWYDWNNSLGDWNASTKIKRWSFAIGGYKEVWAEVKDDIGQTDRCGANIFVHPGYAIIVAGQGGWREQQAIDHGANNAYRVLRNLGFDNDHIFYLNNRSQDIDKNGTDDVDAPASLSHFSNTVSEVKSKIGGNPTPLILFLTGHGLPHYFQFVKDEPVECSLSDVRLKEMLDEFPSETCTLIFIVSCYSGYFITSPVGISDPNRDRIIITGTHDEQERLFIPSLRSSDRIWGNLNNGWNIKDAFTTNTWPGEWGHLWLDDNGDKIGHPPNNLENDGEFAAVTQIGISGTENLELTPWYYIWKRSPGELRVYDSQNRTTGLVNGEVKEEIPDSMYDEENAIVAIFFPTDVYRYEIAGNETATYELDTAFIEEGDATIFTATDIPIQNESIHQYVVLNWTSLQRGEYVVQVWIDQDGDGEFEIKVMSDSEFTPHDITVTNVTPSKNVVGEGYSISITITIMNTGIYTETFNVSVFYDDTIIILPDGKNSTTTTLTSGNSTTVTFTWNTTGVAKGNYTITAKATPIPGETDTTDNNQTDGVIQIVTPGDINADGKVDMKDIGLLCIHYGAEASEPRYVANYDVNCDGKINMKDIGICCIHYGEEDP